VAGVHGPRSDELEPSSINRSRGARGKDGYVAPPGDPVTSDERAGKATDRTVKPDA
jgi:hypothetical protein